MLEDILHRYYKNEKYNLLVLYHIGAPKNSIHFIFDNSTNNCAIVDPAWQPDLFLKIIDYHGYKLKQIWITHYHMDHTNAVDVLAQKTKAKVYASSSQNKYLQLQSTLNLLDDGQKINLGNTTVQIIHTPGHSSDGICYVASEDVFVGDTLFVYGAGHCALPSADVNDLYHSMQKIKKQLSNDLYLRCGHNYGIKYTTTIGEQKNHNPFLLIDNLADFTKYRQEIHGTTRSYPMAPMTKDNLNKLLK